MALLTPYSLLVIAPVIGLAVYCPTQVFVCRATPEKSPYYSLMIGFVAGLAVMAATGFGALAAMQAALRDVIGFSLLNGVTYLALAFGYFNFVNLNIASLRIRMLRELFDSEGGMSSADLLSRYNSGALAALRIDRLVQGGHLVERDGRFQRGRIKFLLVATIFDLLRSLVLGKHAPRFPGSGTSQDGPRLTEKS